MNCLLRRRSAPIRGGAGRFGGGAVSSRLLVHDLEVGEHPGPLIEIEHEDAAVAEGDVLGAGRGMRPCELELQGEGPVADGENRLRACAAHDVGEGGDGAGAQRAAALSPERDECLPRIPELGGDLAGGTALEGPVAALLKSLDRRDAARGGEAGGAQVVAQDLGRPERAPERRGEDGAGGRYRAP